MTTMGTRIKLAREARGLTAQQVADAMEINPSTVFRWESNESRPRTQAELGRLADTLRYPIAYFTASDSAPPPDETVDQLRKKVTKLERDMADLRRLIRERLSGPGDWRLKNGRERANLDRELHLLRSA